MLLILDMLLNLTKPQFSFYETKMIILVPNTHSLLERVKGVCEYSGLAQLVAHAKC